MDFWNEIRGHLLQGHRPGEVVDEFVAVMGKAGVEGLLAVRSLHHLAHVSNLTAEFVDFVERFIGDGDKARTAAMLLCVRETGRVLFNTLDDMSMGLEQLVSSLEDRLMAALQDQPEEEEESDDSTDRDALSTGTEHVRSEVQVRLDSTGVSHRITQPLARAMADVYAECIQFHREMDLLRGLPADDVEAVMSVLLDLQYSVDVQLRRLLSDDVCVDGSHGFTVGLLNLSAAYLADLEMPADLTQAHAVPSP